MSRQLGPDFPDMLHHGIAAAFPIESPNRLIDTLPVKNLARIEGQQLQNVKFLPGQNDRPAASRDSPGCIVHRQISEKAHRAPALPPLFPAQMGCNPGPQLVQVKGLDNVVVRPRLEPGDFVRGFHAGGQEEDGAGDVIPYGLADGQAVHARHIDVQQNQIRPFPRFFQGFRTAVGGQDLVLRCEIAGHHFYNPRFIVHDQQFFTQQAVPPFFARYSTTKSACS